MKSEIKAKAQKILLDDAFNDAVKVYVEAYGCSQNIAETHMLASCLGEITNTLEEADIIVLGTCVVIEHTENRMLRRIDELAEYDKKLIVYGCLPSALRERMGKFENKNVISVPTWEFDKFCDGNALNNAFVWDGVATIPIANGCLGKCAYCITRVARGHLKSREPQWIESMLKKSLQSGACEIRLSAQDTAAYGKDIGKTLPELLRMLVSIDGDFMIRVGMMEPRETLSILKELVNVYKHPKIFKFLHLPVQSGSDRVLARMLRGYRVSDFLRIVESFRKEIPELMLSTDIIVGFPGEEDEDFDETVKLIETVEPDILNITRFSPRPKTPAKKWKRPSTNVVKYRSKYLAELHASILQKKNERYVGREVEVLVTSRGKRGRYMARTRHYRPVILDNVEIGKWYRVELTEAVITHFEARILEKIK